MFEVYGINRIEGLIVLEPTVHGELAKSILKNAKEMSDIIKRDLNLLDEKKTERRDPTLTSGTTDIPAVCSAFESSLTSDAVTLFGENARLKKIYDVKASLPAPKAEAFDEPTFDSEFLLFKPTSLLVAPELNGLSWESSERLYKQTHQENYVVSSTRTAKCRI